MALIGPRIRKYTITATVAGGAGAATATQTIPSGYKLRTLSIYGSTLDADATVSLKDNNGAGSELAAGTGAASTWKSGTDTTQPRTRALTAALTTPLTVVVASGGSNGNLVKVGVTLYRTKSE